jgi:dihydroxyacetone kinase-like protein
MNAATPAMTGSNLRAAFRAIAALMDQNRERLCQLDGELGDGDLGLTMSQGFRAVAQQLDQVETSDIGRQLDAVAEVLGDTVASTMGTLLAAGFAEAARSCSGKSSLSLPEMATLARSIADGIARRGKAKAGDKTILDALLPAAEALKRARDNGASLATGLQLACEAAEQGARESAVLQSRQGRAARYLEKSKGKQDAGAVAGVIIYAGLASVVGSSSR